jgi:hypothetical protein
MQLSQKRESWGTQAQHWIASRHGLNNCKAATLDVSAFTANTHYPNGELLSGLPIAKLTASGKYVPYNGAGSGGAENLAGFLLSNVPVVPGQDIDVVGAILLHGMVATANLPIAVDAAGQADVAGRIIFV